MALSKNNSNIFILEHLISNKNRSIMRDCHLIDEKEFV